MQKFTRQHYFFLSVIMTCRKHRRRIAMNGTRIIKRACKGNKDPWVTFKLTDIKWKNIRKPRVTRMKDVTWIKNLIFTLATFLMV